MDYATFEAPKDRLHHIIWNLLLCDKTTELTDEIIQDNKIDHIYAILPWKEDYPSVFQHIPHTVLEYKGAHEPTVDAELLVAYKDAGHKIDAMARGPMRRNTLIFCNSGYQRSIPFLAYYLTQHHADEVPTLDRALTIILSQVDKTNFQQLLPKYREALLPLGIW